MRETPGVELVAALLNGSLPLSAAHAVPLPLSAYSSLSLPLSPEEKEGHLGKMLLWERAQQQGEAADPSSSEASFNPEDFGRVSSAE